MDEGTKILATVYGKLRTISESSIRRNLKLNDDEGISTLPDAEIFENLALMGYNILPIKVYFSEGLIFPSVEVSNPYHYAMFKSKKYRQQIDMVTKIAAQDLEIASLKARIQMLEDKDAGCAEPSGEDATIKGEVWRHGRKQVGVQVVSVLPTAEVSTVGIPTGNGMVPIASPIFTTASVDTPYSRRKGKEKM
nr:hypothetical protein [Tanacetum cinerariifolium]